MKAATQLRLPFQRLRWKLTLSYTVVTTLTLLVFFFVLLGCLFWYDFVILHNASILTSSIEINAPAASIYFDHGKVDRQGLTRWLHATYLATSFSSSTGFMAAVDLHDQVVAITGKGTLPTTTTFSQQLGSPLTAKLQQMVRTSSKTSTALGMNTPDGNQAALIPIFDPANHALQGVLVWKVEQDAFNDPNSSNIFFNVSVFGIVCAFIIIFTVAGTCFGFFTTRGFTRRLEKLSGVVTKWSRGDFHHTIVDTSKDELAQVAQQLNAMAQQLQDVFSSQQSLVVLEERNRLARELHDSVKQQVFSASMQVSTAAGLLERDAVAAQKHVRLAEALIDQVQQELSSVIHDLRPINLERQSLTEALTHYVREWEQQTGIVADLHLAPMLVLPAEVETACYRTCQEALSNVARHSGAQAVVIRLQRVHELLTLSIVDNGHGFDPQSTPASSVGLQSMRERAEELHGAIEITSTRQHGTTVVVTYPLVLTTT